MKEKSRRPTKQVCATRYEFWALRDIEQGEELTVDSTTYSDHAKASNPKGPWEKSKD